MNKDITRRFFPEEVARVEAGKCAMGDHPLGEFRDALSKKEAGISGMCQECQDKFFGI